MTNAEFAAWRAKHFRSINACSTALGIDREAVAALEAGKTRKGNPYPVPPHIALACAAWTIGLREYRGGAVAIG